MDEFDGEVLVNEDTGREAVDDIIQSWVRRAKGDETWVCLSDSHRNFRKELGTYKANRVTPKPPHYKAMSAYLEDNYRIERQPSLEADDVMGIIQTSPKMRKRFRTIIVSSDKDMKTIPGNLLNPGVSSARPVRISPDEAYRWWMYQTLMGDAVDGYGGCPGIGPKKAEKILDAPKRLRLTNGKFKEAEPCSIWQAVLDRFTAAGLTFDDALLQARFARILHYENYDLKEKEVRLWTP
jgi:DNA polymerase-1